VTDRLRAEPVEVHDRGWPLLFIRIPPFLAVGTVQSFVAAIEHAYARNERFAVVIDTTAVSKFPGAPARQILSDWVADARRAERERTFTVGTALVIASGPLRAFTAAVNLVRRHATPQQWTATVAEAVEWAHKRLVEEHVALTPGSETLLAEMTSRPTRARERA
jgi:hypothetical protein